MNSSSINEIFNHLMLSKIGLLLDSSREQTIQTQIQLNSKVTTRESAAVLPSEEECSSASLEHNSSLSVTDGCPASRAQVSFILTL